LANGIPSTSTDRSIIAFLYPKKEEAGAKDTGFIKSVPSRPFAESKNLLFTRWELVSATSGFPMMLVGPAHRD
jgi:hypothetical protein